MASVAVGITAISWLTYFFEIVLNPFVVTGLMVCVVAFSVYKLLKLKKHLHNLRQGIKGERYVGQVLEELRVDGYKVFHDIVGENHNIDHLIVGPQGIFVIETKTWGKAANIKTAAYDGKILMLNNHPAPKNPIAQVLSSAHWVREVLYKSIGTHFFVQPIITLPSKFIEPAVNKVFEKENVHVLNPKNIRSFLNASKKQNSLSEEQINQIAFHLSRINVYKAD